MPARPVWRPKARADLKTIYLDIGQHQPLAAERYFLALREKANLLQDNPRLGQRRPDVAPSARMLVEAPFVMLYETIPDIDEGPIETVRIVRVLDGRRNLESLFRPS